MSTKSSGEQEQMNEPKRQSIPISKCGAPAPHFYLYSKLHIKNSRPNYGRLFFPENIQFKLHDLLVVRILRDRDLCM